MRHGKIKQVRILRVAGLAGNSSGGVGLKPAAKRGDLRLQGLTPERDGLPFIALPGEREDIALLGANKPEYERLVRPQKRLHLFDTKRVRLCERGVLRKFSFEPLAELCALSVDLCKLPAQRFGLGGITRGKGAAQCSALLPAGGGKVLSGASNLHELAGASSKPRGGLAQSLAGTAESAPLHGFEHRACKLSLARRVLRAERKGNAREFLAENGAGRRLIADDKADGAYAGISRCSKQL